jgi:anti-sigma factor RsiW
MGKHNHPPFNDWLLSGDTLTPEQNQSLREHLQTCQECNGIHAAWSEVQAQFHSAGEVAPAPGFTSRWQTRLTLQNQKRQKRNAWIMFFGASFMAAIILGLVASQALGLFRSPVSILSGLVYLWTYGFVASERVVEFLGIAARVLPPLTLIGVIFFIGISSLMSVLWLVTYRQLTNARRFSIW